MENTLITIITDLEKKIDAYFGHFYNAEVGRSVNQNLNYDYDSLHNDDKQKVVINNYTTTTPFSAIPYWSMWYPQTVVNNNTYTYPTKTYSKIKNEDDNDITSSNIFTAAIAGIVLSFSSVYVIAKDEYITYWLSDIDNDLNTLSNLSRMSKYQDSIWLVKHAFDDWKSAMTKRTKPKIYAKFGCLGSCGLLIGSYLFSNSMGIGAGLLGLTGSGCYLLWKNLTHKHYSEKDYFNKFIEEINKLKLSLENNNIYST